MPVPASVTRSLAKGINLSHWLSQHSLDEPHLQSYIGEKDFALIAKLGFMHVRLPIDTALLQSPDGSLREQGFTYVDRALDWAQANRLGVVIDLHPVPAPKIAQDATAYAHFEKLWQAIAQRYVRRPLDVVYELLNEPVEPNPQAWRDTAIKLVQAIRKVDKRHTVIVCGHNWSGPDDLPAVRPIEDDNIVYTFHFYLPHEFTHQGATWGSAHWRPLRNVPYPLHKENVQPLLTGLPENPATALRRLAEQGVDIGWIERRMMPVVEYQKQYRVPLYCGEFGVYRAFSPPDSRYRWLADVVKTLQKHRIGWAMWDYKGGFALLATDKPDPKADEGVVRALGLGQ